MTYKAQPESRLLPLRFNKDRPRIESWWAPVWRGLVVEPTAKHYRSMHTAIWLYLYFVVHADRKTGTLFRRIDTIAQEMGVKSSTIRRWFAVLVRRGYVTRKSTGRSVHITIQRWKRLRPHRGF
jgi:hypothetical protein